MKALVSEVVGNF